MGGRIGRQVREMKSVEGVRGRILWGFRDREGIVEKVIEELLSELFLHVIGYERVRFGEETLPQWTLVGMTLDCIVGGCKEGAAVESIESRDETGPLEESNQEGIVMVFVEDLGKGVA